MAILWTPIYIQNMTMAVGGHTGNVIIMPQMQVYACYISDLVVPSGVLLLTQPLGSTFLVCTPVTTEPPLVFSISGQPQGLLLVSGICTSLFLQPCVTLQPLIQQPQAPKESEQAVADTSEEQRKLEAAEALLALSNSSPAPTEPMHLAQPCNQSAPAGDRILQPPVPDMFPRPANSN
ncbi:doublesex- and mab-3-related transcription factor C1-like [Ochotona princeps]|uniref:doublesex- and mab-3-related transcription factor C1-like n=1 Tax=Ochotona princeps TaxID=9978 RepID=UPI002715223B|nr:doublesex- and mab-3-related transcription factor C1-like [Ochotona princeps]